MPPPPAYNPAFLLLCAAGPGHASHHGQPSRYNSSPLRGEPSHHVRQQLRSRGSAAPPTPRHCSSSTRRRDPSHPTRSPDPSHGGLSRCSVVRSRLRRPHPLPRRRSAAPPPSPSLSPQWSRESMLATTYHDPRLWWVPIQIAKKPPLHTAATRIPYVCCNEAACKLPPPSSMFGAHVFVHVLLHCLTPSASPHRQPRRHNHHRRDAWRRAPAPLPPTTAAAQAREVRHASR